MPEQAILHVCPSCDRVFDSPSVCGDGTATEPRLMNVTKAQHSELSMRGGAPSEQPFEVIALRRERDHWKQGAQAAEAQLAEARAEAERLREEVRSARAKAIGDAVKEVRRLAGSGYPERIGKLHDVADDIERWASENTGEQS